MAFLYKSLPCREARYMKGADVHCSHLPERRFGNNFAAVRSQSQACRSMAGDQQNMFDAWDRPKHRHGIARQRTQTHADIANLGLGQAWCDAQCFTEHFLDAIRGGVRVKAGVSFPSGANRDTTVRPGDHIMTAEGTEHGPSCGINP